MRGGTAACCVTLPTQDVRKAEDFGAVIPTREQVGISTQVTEAFGRPLEPRHEDTVGRHVDAPGARGASRRGVAPPGPPRPTVVVRRPGPVLVGTPPLGPKAMVYLGGSCGSCGHCRNLMMSIKSIIRGREAWAP